MTLATYLLLGICVLSSLAAVAVNPQLPDLRWEKRSDWVDVRSLGAKGDGVADDTAAIQAALDSLVDWERSGWKPVYGPKTVYLPPGTYRITDTLHLYRMSGAMLVGHGRGTRVVWDGAAGKTMFWSDGSRCARFIGITWDGRGKAGRGYDHAATTKGAYFETEILHQYEAFIGMQHGVNLGISGQGGVATDNVFLKHCLFIDCARGISVDNFNYYHYSIDGCEFHGCGTGVYFRRGMGYVRNSHFRGSTETDVYIYLGYPVDCSVRRVTSVGSRRFVTGGGGGWVSASEVSDCRVSGWTDPDGAIVIDSAASLLLYDIVFTNPPGTKPPIRLANRMPDYPILLTVTGNRCAGVSSLIDPGPNSRIITLPSGKEKRLLRADDETFFPGRVDVVPGKIFDARRDFRAKGDDKTDDTAALQATIDAARACGKDAMAYFPPGRYRVSKTLVITGADYRVGGGGNREHCRLQWTGSRDGVVVHVQDPRQVKLEYVEIRGGENTGCCAIRQTGTGAGSNMRYEGISVPGAYIAYTPRPRGLELISLGRRDVVLMEGNNNGDLRITNCGRATILVSSLVASPIIIEGDERIRDGFIGFLAYMGLNVGDPLIHVKNNQNLVISDAYLEVTPGTHVALEGNPGEPAGAVTIMGTERYTMHPGAAWLVGGKKVEQRADIIRVSNYKGRYCEGRNLFSNPPKDGYLVAHTGDRPLDLIFLANCWMTLDAYWKNGQTRPAFADAPRFQLGKGARLIQLQNTIYDLQGADKAGDRMVVGTWPEQLPNRVPRGGLAQVTAALDDVRRLGAIDLQLNYGR